MQCIVAYSPKSFILSMRKIRLICIVGCLSLRDTFASNAVSQVLFFAVADLKFKLNTIKRFTVFSKWSQYNKYNKCTSKSKPKSLLRLNKTQQKFTLMHNFQEIKRWRQHSTADLKTKKSNPLIHDFFFFPFGQQMLIAICFQTLFTL